jgi:hypothetical protein
VANPNHDERGRFAPGDSVIIRNTTTYPAKVIGPVGPHMTMVESAHAGKHTVYNHDLKAVKASHAKAIAIAKEQGHAPSTVEEAKARIKALKSQIRKVQGETKALSDARVARLERKEGMPMGSKKEWKAKQWAKLKAAGAYLDMTKK